MSAPGAPEEGAVMKMQQLVAHAEAAETAARAREEEAAQDLERIAAMARELTQHAVGVGQQEAQLREHVESLHRLKQAIETEELRMRSHAKLLLRLRSQTRHGSPLQQSVAGFVADRIRLEREALAEAPGCDIAIRVGPQAAPAALQRDVQLTPPPLADGLESAT